MIIVASISLSSIIYNLSLLVSCSAIENLAVIMQLKCKGESVLVFRVGQRMNYLHIHDIGSYLIRKANLIFKECIEQQVGFPWQFNVKLCERQT